MSLPQHISIIPDGNRRWAKQRNLPAALGHREGAKTLEKVLEAFLELNIPYFTFWGASTANLKERSRKEVEFLTNIFKKYLNKLKDSEKIHTREIRVRVLGRLGEFSEGLEKLARKVEEKTKNYKKYNFTLLLAYSGTDEMINAIEEIAKVKSQNSKVKIDENLIKSNLWTYALPPVDLVIRTGGEPHWSAGFMMWDISEAQFYFTPTLWPDFSKEEFKKSIENYSQIERRFGK